MKLKFAAVIALFATTIGSCQKENLESIDSTSNRRAPSEETISSRLVGTYNIGYFESAKQVLTPAYRGFKLELRASGQAILTNNIQSYEGKWQLNRGDQSKLSISFVTGNDLADLLASDRWEIIDRGNMTINMEAKHYEMTKYLHLVPSEVTVGANDAID